MSIRQAQKEAMQLSDAIDAKFRRESTPAMMMIDLVEEVGELAEVIRAREFYKTQPKEDLPTELADILYDILRIAEHYDVDLETAYEKTMQKYREKFL